MDYGMIGKIEKAKIYAAERDDRIHFQSLQVSILGENDVTHQVSTMTVTGIVTATTSSHIRCAVIRWRWNAFSEAWWS